jgi:hypothetical protein
MNTSFTTLSPVMENINTTPPEACLAGCSFPLTKGDFFQMLNYGSEGNFVHLKYGGYWDYTPEAIWEIYRDFAEPVSECLEAVGKLGVKVINQFKKNDLQKIREYKVFTLIAHYDYQKDEVDFFDGIIGKYNFVQVFPADFGGIIDLTLCNAVFIRNELRNKLGNRILSFNAELPIIQSLLLYKQVINNLKRFEINYIDCYTKTILDLKKTVP